MQKLKGAIRRNSSETTTLDTELVNCGTGESGKFAEGHAAGEQITRLQGGERADAQGGYWQTSSLGL
eukprot:2799549-Rhodomonas_salina.2